MVRQQEYLCYDCTEEFTLTCEENAELNYCPFCGADMLYHEDDWDEDGDLE